MVKRYMNVTELSSYIFKSKSWIYKKVGKKEIPNIKLGNGLLFDVEEIDKWVRNDLTENFQIPELREI